MIFITGDIHGDPNRLNTHSFYEQKKFDKKKKDNVVIIAGDFGIIWNSEKESGIEKFWLNWLEEKPFTTVFVEGNHECFPRIYQYPVKEWNGGKVHEIRPNVLHLMRGEIYTIEGLRFFTFGGASSHDISDGIIDPAIEEDWHEKARKWNKAGKMYRVKGISWWEEELPTEEEMQHGLDNLKAVGNKVDYIITHSPSSSELTLMGNGEYKTDILTDYLEKIKTKVEYKNHIFGHMHVNKQLNDKDVCLYEQIVRLV